MIDILYEQDKRNPSNEAIIEALPRIFNVTDEPIPYSYILVNGKFLDPNHSAIREDGHSDYYMIGTHATVDFVLNSCAYGYKKYSTPIDNGSEFMREINAVRLNNAYAKDTAYIELPKDKMTNAQYYALEDWLNFIPATKLDIYTSAYISGNKVNYKSYDLNEYFPEDIIKLIKRYYSSGTLYERKRRK